MPWYYKSYDIDYSNDGMRIQRKNFSAMNLQKTKAKYYDRPIKETLKTAIK